MDQETEGQHTERPHPSNGVSTHAARQAASMRHVPHLAWRYWDFRDKLSTDDGMLLKGLGLIIPEELQEYLSRLHEGHLSTNKVQENAKQHMYWTGIDADIEDCTKQCWECIKRSQVAKEPLQPHDIPEGPWRKLGMEYFNFNGNSYVLICDYFSKFPFFTEPKHHSGH